MELEYDYTQDHLNEFHNYVNQSSEHHQNLSDFYLSLPPSDFSKIDLIRFSIHTILGGIQCALVFLSMLNSFAKIREQSVNVPSTIFLFYELTSIVLCLLSICTLVEYFLLWDFNFHHNIEWKTHHQWLSYLIDFAGLARKSLIVALGFHHLLTLTYCGYCSSTGNMLKRCLLPWTLFAFVSLTIPVVAIVIRSELEWYTLVNTFETIGLPFFLCFALFILIFVYGKRRFLSSNLMCLKEEILATKLILFYLLLVVTWCVTDIILFDAIPLFLHQYVMQVLEIAIMLSTDLHLILFPALYLFFFDENMSGYTLKIFPCLNSKNISETEQVTLDTSLVLGQPLAAAAAPIPHDSVIPISEASSVESTSFFRRFYHTGTITYATLTESHNTEMNSLIDVSLDEAEEGGARGGGGGRK